MTAPRMPMIDHFSQADGLATFRPIGEHTLVSIVEAVNRTIAHCRELRICRLLVVTHKVTGVSPPTMIDRFLAVEDWAHAARGLVVVGLAMSAKNIDPQKFGVKVGRMHDNPVGPHPRGSCQLTIGKEQLSEVLSWLVLNRKGLTVFTHAQTGNALKDHTDHVIWLGPSETLELSQFR